MVNRKRTPTFDTLLGDVTSGVKAPFGAVRNLYTPVGGTRVLDLEGLSTGKTYVAGGKTRFQKGMEYGIKPRPRRARSQVANQRPDIFSLDQSEISRTKNRKFCQNGKFVKTLVKMDILVKTKHLA